MSPVQYEAIFVGIAAIAAAIAYVFLRRVSRSPLSRTLRSIREDETVAACFGRNVFAVQLKAFVVSGFMAGVGGGLLVEYLGSWTPSGVPAGVVEAMGPVENDLACVGPSSRTCAETAFPVLLGPPTQLHRTKIETQPAAPGFRVVGA
ncbi:MAG: ABC transporter permease subunit [Jatrophihabitantaceae bacterium]